MTHHHTSRVGDVNSGPDAPSFGDRLAYWVLRTAGLLVDTWWVLHPGVPGRNADLGPELTEPATSLEVRIDVVLVRGAVVPVRSGLFGTSRTTPAGRWASDHLGHAAQLRLR